MSASFLYCYDCILSTVVPEQIYIIQKYSNTPEDRFETIIPFVAWDTEYLLIKASSAENQ